MPAPVCAVPLSHPPVPEEAFRLLAHEEGTFFLDSALPMPGLARYSILGCRPFRVMQSTGRRILLRDATGERRIEEDPFREMRRLLAEHKFPPHPEAPFIGGAVGYLGYDLCHFIEHLPRRTVADIPLPELYLAFHDAAIVYDLQEQRAWAVGCAAGGRNAAQAAGELAERLTESLPPSPKRGQASFHNGEKQPDPFSPPFSSPDPFSSRVAGEMRCNFSRAEYLRAVARCIEYIGAGDIFQVNLSRRFEAPCALPPWQLYLRLRRINPAPMAAYLDLGEGRAVVSASPERFLSLRGRRVETRPIKGTRPRGASAQEDRALAEELLRSEKDNAELAMIVDLERNDLGRVCSYGTVRVEEARRLESYPTVHHLVATVSGALHAGRDRVDLLRATFPGGSITGAPKVRAMQIIDELEPTARSVYTGAVGFLGFDGAMDLNIAIRTILAAQGGGLAAGRRRDRRRQRAGSGVRRDDAKSARSSGGARRVGLAKVRAYISPKSRAHSFAIR